MGGGLEDTGFTQGFPLCTHTVGPQLCAARPPERYVLGLYYAHRPLLEPPTPPHTHKVQLLSRVLQEETSHAESENGAVTYWFCALGLFISVFMPLFFYRQSRKFEKVLNEFVQLLPLPHHLLWAFGNVCWRRHFGLLQ